MTGHGAGIPLGNWLADLRDEQLAQLLELRPDLTQPPPGSIVALASRAQSRQSLRAATDELDFGTLAVVDALLVLHADTAAVPVTKLATLLGDRMTETDLNTALQTLRQRAIVWGDEAVRVPTDVSTGLPWHPGQAVLEDSAPAAHEIGQLLDGLDDAQSGLLDRLVSGSPVGRTRDAAPGTPADRPVQRLLSAGLLRQIDAETVILPRRVGQVLRGQRPGPDRLGQPEPAMSTAKRADADAAAAGMVIDLLRDVEAMLDVLGQAPVRELRTGGLGMREVKRLAKSTGIDEQRLGLILELGASAGIIGVGVPDPEPPGEDGSFWAPTPQADRFAEADIAARWQQLAATWLELPARPSLVGRRGPDGKPIGALSEGIVSTAAPLDRRLLLDLLAELPSGRGLDAAAASEILVWRRPRWAPRLQPDPVADLIDEATALGIVGRGALSGPGRALLSDAGSSEAASAMARVLPEPIDHFLVQADLTVVVPGPLQRELSEHLAQVAAVESAGAAMVYRISEASIRRALDTGRTADDLHGFFRKHSKTPVPQGLTYLIDDVARRHGRLRVGMARAFVRCEDPALLAQVVASQFTQVLELRMLAPTVAVSQAPIAALLSELREAGFVPAAEDSAGAIVDLRPHRARVKAAPHHRVHRTVQPPTTETVEAIVAMLRKVAASPPATRVDAGTAVLLLQQAVRDQESVVMGYVDPAGVATQRVVAPISVRGGQLVAFDSASSRVRDFAIHRVTSVVAVDGD